MLTGEQATDPGYNTYGTVPVALRVTDDNPVSLGGPQTNIYVCNVVIKPPPHCPHPDAGGGLTHTYNGFLNVAGHLRRLGLVRPGQRPDDLQLVAQRQRRLR